MTVNDKIKTSDNKIEQSKAQYDLDRQAAKISALSSGNVSRYKFIATNLWQLRMFYQRKGCQKMLLQSKDYSVYF